MANFFIKTSLNKKFKGIGKKGDLGPDYLGKIIVGLVILIIVFVGMGILAIKLFGVPDFVKNLFGFWR
jgi:hypothetical protein